MNIINKVATIVPLNNLQSIQHHKIFMALSHVGVYPAYIDYFRERSDEGKFVLVDNSAIEVGAPGDFSEYMKIAIAMHSSEIMLPDHFQDSEKTLIAAEQAMDVYQRLDPFNKMNVMVIPQGLNFNQWLRNLSRLGKLVKDRTGKKPTIGISCRYTEMFHGDRSLAVLGTHAMDYDRIHLLGAYANPKVELKSLLRFSFVRSVDSSYPTVYTQHGIELTDEMFSNTRPERNIDFGTDFYDPSLLERNINTWLKACDPLI